MSAPPGGAPLGSDLREAGLWQQLLQSIAEGTVIPIVGRDLLSLEPGTGFPSLYPMIATNLATALGVPADVPAAAGTNPLSAVAAHHIMNGGEPDDIYQTLDAVVQSTMDLPIPVALKKLAAIERFSLFVTTTFDSLLARALADARGADPRVLRFSTKQAADEWTPHAGATVYHLFGRVSPLQDYVVTEEDALEFVFSLLTSRSQPTQLLHELSQRTLLIVGCSFPAWAVRFFLRLTRGRRLLFADRERIAFIVDPFATQDAGLLQFLKAFKTRTEVFTRFSAQEFVDELSARWSSQAPDPPRDELMPAGAVFVSYASENRQRAQALVESLRARGLPVWFDRDALEPGDRWRERIERGIEQASAFIPILSSDAIRGADRVYIEEWKLSLQRNRRVAFDDRFLFPVAIEQLDPDNAAIPAEFRSVQWTTIADDTVPDELVVALNEAIRRKKAGARR